MLLAWTRLPEGGKNAKEQYGLLANQDRTKPAARHPKPCSTEGTGLGSADDLGMRIEGHPDVDQQTLRVHGAFHSTPIIFTQARRVIRAWRSPRAWCCQLAMNCAGVMGIVRVSAEIQVALVLFFGAARPAMRSALRSACAIRRFRFSTS